MATVIDVAKEADVSVATVSRVLNNSFMVTEEKRARVLAAIEKVGYKVSTKNKELKRNNSKVILVITGTLLEDLFSSFQDTASDLGYHVIYHYCGNQISTESAKEVVNILKNNVIAGIVLLDITESNNDFKQLLSHYPIVQIGNPLIDTTDNYIVSADDRKIAYDVVSHLIETGKKRIAIISAETEGRFVHFERDRERGYMDALRDNDLPCDDSLKFHVDFTMDGGSDATKKILASENRPDAIFCISDTLAVGCIYRLKRAGISIPDEISVAGIDNTEITEFFDPPITTVDQSFKEIGSETIKMLVSLINGELSRGRKIYIEHQLIIRKSTQKDN
ncbi:LacI family repressor for deo operon, udp, cdd, tsx, nupC, and nupG [Clostridium saccharoperbutylacetonicum]|uniref:Transcriptional regulator, LacI family n=1 Tax=Clostridium saccharoperbutylacetonicum N1-4(HMT) TaxID=931276 RepID=M1LYX9_9CLOT|nr:LacI family DNA-binding transcriptional regulator [Clostridium saccharoperbutylacetonicum]AGF58510.1 transcriptional regulator, LacI family [Clostridium saccharoperbutylacetonicum N1-4(HMT)]NRT60712.1 LacI family repressor for deo operon, udp, cdd, tsx, nupC, and nupG [Clostridium saccharoperbutylacetonicum]NSB24026.1 LacI family repressor for deo operon, udp, cdd, tsx, nupC, and nupG [Clostridium saccharoperbutylacetonicum]NSB43403.1 LacI family repressor for deo operon, udp, cdd, tsx, nupC